VFQAGIYAGMTMYFPTHVVTGGGSAFVFLLYVIQLAWTIVGAAIFLVGDRKALSTLSHTPGLGDGGSGDSEAPPSMQRAVLASEVPPSLEQRTPANG
jgi:hypothetical protein